MAEREMRMRVTRRQYWTLSPTVVRRWTWRCEWCGTGARFPEGVRLDVAHDDAWRHGWQCWGWLVALDQLAELVVGSVGH